MSYARLSADSDVYVFTTSSSIECCACSLPGAPMFFEARSNEAMIEHLKEHVAQGHLVPDRVFENLADPADKERNEAYWKERRK